MTELSPEITSLLSSSPEEGSRRLAIRWIEEAEQAAQRLMRADDEEALHDLRVALRKLRTVLRTYREALRGAIGKKRREKLRALVASTGEGRDTEVQLSWLASIEGLPAEAERGTTWLAERLHARKHEAYLALRAEQVPALVDLLPKLKSDLAAYRLERVVLEKPEERTFADATADLLCAQAVELRDTLRQVRSAADEVTAHEARIQGKRLRYLLEPLRDGFEQVKEIVKSLKGLQELLGELNDVSVRREALRKHVEAAALDRARLLALEAEGAARSSSEVDEQPGLLALMRISTQRKHELFSVLFRDWLPAEAGLDRLIEQVMGFAGELRSSQRPPEEIERKYLLDALPERVRGERFIHIDQGYVPGESLHERLRRTKSLDGDRWYRCVKLGRGLKRIEVEEETTREVFTKMWSLTRGKRIRKRRYEIDEGGLRWQIDEFLDRELVLAEVELPTEDIEVTLPDWLAPHVVREVTEEGTYVNLNLAR